jgi:type I restriction enzyme R subunit
VADELDDLVRSSANFGYLIEHEPVLAFDGASAESYIYTDPDAAMFKARRFLEALSKKAVAVFGVRSEAKRLYDRIHELRRAGVIDKHIQDLCDVVRTAGNQAVHEHMKDVHVALRVVRHCFDLGLWLHNTIISGQETRVFVPPRPPALVPSARDEGAPEALRKIRAMLTTFERRLVLLELERGGPPAHSTSDVAPVVAASMERQTSLGEAVRSAEEQVESRRSELAARLDERLVDNQAGSRPQHDELRRRTRAAADLLKQEAERLDRIAQEVAQSSDEDDSADSTFVLNVAGDKSTNFVVGKIYGSTVNPTLGGGRRR